MGRIWQELQNPAWWFSAVIAGLLLNVLAAYLKEWADKFGESQSARRRLRRTEAEEKRKSRLRHLAENPEAVGEARHEELRLLCYGLLFIGFSIQGFVLVIAVDFDPYPTDVIGNRTAKVMALFISSLTLVISASHLYGAGKLRRELREAKRFRERPRSEDKQPQL